MTGGYFPLWRKILDHEFYKEPRTFSRLEAWLDILLSANYRELPVMVKVKGKVYECNYAECIISERELSRRWNWSKSKVHRFLISLKSKKMIEFTADHQPNRIKVINYMAYDLKRTTSRTVSPSHLYINNKKKEKKVERKEKKKPRLPNFQKLRPQLQNDSMGKRKRLWVFGPAHRNKKLSGLLS
jgi:hypothetical protein